MKKEEKKQKKLFVARGMNPTSSALSITVDCENCKISDKRLKLVLVEGLRNLKPLLGFTCLYYIVHLIKSPDC